MVKTSWSIVGSYLTLISTAELHGIYAYACYKWSINHNYFGATISSKCEHCTKFNLQPAMKLLKHIHAPKRWDLFDVNEPATFPLVLHLFVQSSIIKIQNIMKTPVPKNKQQAVCMYVAAHLHSWCNTCFQQMAVKDNTLLLLRIWLHHRYHLFKTSFKPLVRWVPLKWGCFFH